MLARFFAGKPVGYPAILILVVMGCIAWLEPAIAQSSGWTFQDIAFPGATFTSPTGINDFGTVVGTFADAGGEHAFLFDHGKYTRIDYPGAVCTRATAINNSGEIVGLVSNASSSCFSDDLSVYGFLWSGGSFSQVAVPAPAGGYLIETEPSGINNHGEIVGNYCLSSQYICQFGQFCFIFAGGVYTTIGVPIGSDCGKVNDAGVVVGNVPYQGTSFLYSGGTLTAITVPGSPLTWAYGINNKNQVVGYATGHGFVLSGSSVTIVDPPAANTYQLGTYLFGINNKGQVVGLYTGQDNEYHGFMASPMQYGIDLSDVPSSTEWDGLIANFNPTFVIADTWGGGTPKPAQQILASAPTGIKKAAYLLLNYDDPSQPGATQVGYALAALGSQYQSGNANGNIAFMAIDIEPICYQWDSSGNCLTWEDLPQDIDSIEARFERIYDAVQAVERAGLSPIIYTNQSAWSQIAGGTTPGNPGLPFSCIPLWNPQYDFVDDLGANWQPFGAWNQRVGKQYAENDAAFGVALVDVNVFDPSVFSGGSWGMALDDTKLVRIARNKYRLNRKTNRYTQTVTIQNTSGTQIQGPISLALDGLSFNATLANGSGYTSCTVPIGSSLINVQPGPLAPRQSVKVTLQFSNPTNQVITYTLRVLSGSGIQ